MRVAALGQAMLDGLRRGGVVGVVKHMPGHGRALVDSHWNCRASRPTPPRSKWISSRSRGSTTRRWA
jgi:beta-glucosidase-like glycosyl hydrolase